MTDRILDGLTRRPNGASGESRDVATEHSWGVGKTQIPVVALVMNLSPGSPVLSFDEVQTLYHEWGHALNSLLSRTRFQHLSGTRGPLDLVEVINSQLVHNGVFLLHFLFAFIFEFCPIYTYMFVKNSGSIASVRALFPMSRDYFSVGKALFDRNDSTRSHGAGCCICQSSFRRDRYPVPDFIQRGGPGIQSLWCHHCQCQVVLVIVIESFAGDFWASGRK